MHPTQKPEYILCAGTYIDNGVVYDGQPENIERGFVLFGHRHDSPMGNYINLLEKYYPLKENKLMVNGFLTSKNRFATREEAYIIALKAGQIEKKNTEEKYPILISEDLY